MLSEDEILKRIENGARELSEDELEAVSGGTDKPNPYYVHTYKGKKYLISRYDIIKFGGGYAVIDLTGEIGGPVEMSTDLNYLMDKYGVKEPNI